MRCPHCGLDVVEQAAFCHHCGQRLNDQQQTDAGEKAVAPAAAEDQAASPAGILREAAALREIQAEEPEKELWQGGYSSRAMIGAWLTCGLITVAVLAGGFLFHLSSGKWWLVLLGLIALVWFYELLVLCYRRMNVHYLLTTQRFLHETGILRRMTDRIEILDIDDIAFEQTVLERLVGVGSISIHSTDRTHPEVWLRGVGDVKRVAGIMDDARRIERRRRGLHFEKI